IVLPALASVVAALIGAAATYLSKPGNELFRSSELVTAHFSDWGLDRTRQTISYRLTAKPFDFAEYIDKSKKDKYRLIVPIRPRTGLTETDGQYDFALDFPFESTVMQQLELNQSLRQAIATGCVSSILFRLSTDGLARIPFKTPFVPKHYGRDLQMLP